MAAAAERARPAPAGRGARDAGHRRRRAREDRDRPPRLEVRTRAGRGGARVHEARADPRLDWRGLHVHLGSQVDDPGVLEGVVRWFRAFCDEHALEPRLIDVGGGLEHPVRPRVGAGRPCARLRGRCRRAPAPVPRGAAADRAGPLGRRPRGRDALPRASRARPPPTARAGWRSTAAWPTTCGRRSTALLQRRRSGPPRRGAERARRARRPPLRVRATCSRATVDLPASLAPGDLVAFAATGAYGQSMASTYNAIAAARGRPRRRR